MNKVSIISFTKTNNMNNIFDKNLKINRDNILEPFINLKKIFFEKGIEINTDDITDIRNSSSSIFLRLDLLRILKCVFYKKKSIYIQFEPPVISPLHSKKNMRKIQGLFDIILTWNDDLVDNKKFFKFYFPMPENVNPNDLVPFSEKKLLTNISGNKLIKRKNELYSKRIEAIRYFEASDSEFEFYGTGWSKENYSSYKGEIDSKLEVLKKYKFSLCYENESEMNGLISEKIFDCFYAKTVPIFWGAKNIEDYIPKKCYIDFREFESYEELEKYISEMSIQEYGTRIDSIRKYLNSSNFGKHSSDYFAETIYNALNGIEGNKSLIKAVYSLLYYSIFISIEKVILLLKKLLRIFVKVSSVK